MQKKNLTKNRMMNKKNRQNPRRMADRETPLANPTPTIPFFPFRRNRLASQPRLRPTNRIIQAKGG
jgi:hypothetical protein